jgi:hypothetical protein
MEYNDKEKEGCQQQSLSYYSLLYLVRAGSWQDYTTGDSEAAKKFLLNSYIDDAQLTERKIEIIRDESFFAARVHFIVAAARRSLPE